MIYLYIIHGNEAGKEMSFAQSSVNLGRASQNAVRLTDLNVSRQHALIEREGEDYVLSDLQSENGTFLNESQIVRSVLKSDDVIQLGLTLFLFSTTPVGDPLSRRRPQVESASESKGVFDSTAETLYEANQVSELNPENRGNKASDGVIPSPGMVAGMKDHLRFLYRASLATSRHQDTRDMLENVVDLVFDWIEADRCCILTRENGLGAFKPLAFRVRDAEGKADGNSKFVCSQSIIKMVEETQEPVHTTSAGNDERFRSAQSLLGVGVNEAICIPIRGRNQLLGMIYADTCGGADEEFDVDSFESDSSSLSYSEMPIRSGQDSEVDFSAYRFNRDHLRMLVVIAQQAAAAIENASFFKAIVKSERLTAVGQTMAAMSHQIKNILQGINGGKHLLNNGLELGSLELAGKGWNIVNRNQERISNLVMNMMSYGKRKEPHLRELDLNQLIERAIETFSEAQPELQIDWMPQQHVASINLDSQRITMALQNVMECLCDLHEDPSETIISVGLIQADESYVRISLAVSGLQLSTERVKNIFDPLGSHPEDMAIGLSLAVAREIAREHGGELSLHVGNKLERQEFTFLLPTKVSSTQRARVETVTNDLRPFGE